MPRPRGAAAVAAAPRGAQWAGVRAAQAFGPQARQLPLYGDMSFRSAGMSEDCLYLNVWAPARSAREQRPVRVYFYGGGFQAGDGSEPRYDGASMASQGIVTVTVNYRLGVFSFLAHPALTQASPHHASGNYGLLDQQAALRWVQQNIAAFGGDPGQVTIGGESVGSVSVSAPLAVALHAHTIALLPPRGQRIGRLLRLNPDQTATVHLLLYQDTVDEQWGTQALESFDPAKISYVDATGYELQAVTAPIE